ncbi:hypothetical protein MLD38_015546 [Melastoma candidum]|uniref:Uncharacterized protein n=1 Tax=Melastoma candidum TaxID=119954 RepID=A0ACB9RGL6_9MYRT|nr:hypothetical protein MLD38_015546 [Melastoma candidum]
MGFPLIFQHNLLTPLLLDVFERKLKGIFENKGSRDLLAKRWDEKVAYHEEEVDALEKKLAEAKAKLDRVRKKRDEVTPSKDTGGL